MASRAEIEASNCDRDLNAITQAAVKQQQEDLRQVLKQLEAIHIVQTSIDKLDGKFDLSKLPWQLEQLLTRIKANSDTRMDLLREIYGWADDVDGKCIFWLKGMGWHWQVDHLSHRGTDVRRPGPTGRQFLLQARRARPRECESLLHTHRPRLSPPDTAIGGTHPPGDR
jgi:hypothetical protein